MTNYKIGTQEEWAAGRAQLLVREQEHTRLSDELARERRELPWVPVEKDYRVADRFQRSQAMPFRTGRGYAEYAMMDH